MIRWHDGNTLPVEPLAAVAHDTGSVAVEILKGHLAQADDDLRGDQSDFPDEMDVGTALAFFQRRRTVVFGPAFDDVRDVNTVPREADAP